MDFITWILQIINIVILIAVVSALGLMLYYGTKIIVHKGKSIDSKNSND